MKQHYLAIVALAAGSPAVAQSTTECRTGYTGVVRCQTNPTPRVDWRVLTDIPTPYESLMEGYERGARLRAIEEQQQLLEQQRADLARQREAQERMSAQGAEAASRNDTLRKEVGRMLSLRQCKEAESTALAAGDIELAASAKYYCKATE